MKKYTFICFILLTSCANPRYLSVFSNNISGPEIYIKTKLDDKPWWDLDISHIKDAIPTFHNGQYKTSPYIVKNKKYTPLQMSKDYKEKGYASWYGTRFHGNKTANDEIYDLYKMTAAHRTLPLPSYVKVTNTENGNSVIVRVNDRGPFHSDRIIDLSYVAAKKLDFANKGTAQVLIEAIDPLTWRNENYDPQKIN